MFTRWVTIALGSAIFALCQPVELLAQSISSRPLPAAAGSWQPPVRIHRFAAPPSSEKAGEIAASGQPVATVQYVEPLNPQVPVAAVWGNHAHQIIEAPRIEYPAGSTSHPHRGQQATTNPTPKSQIDPVPHLLNQHATQPPRATIPDASYRSVWKSPFSYGYFGASGSRKWTRHFGYRDRDKEWRLR